MKRVVLVSGSRDFPSKALLMDVMRQSFRAGDCLIHGCARGVDSWAEEAVVSDPDLLGWPVARDQTHDRCVSGQRRRLLCRPSIARVWLPIAARYARRVDPM